VCRQVHGHDRAGELTDAIKDGTARVVERHERITGYATALAFFGHAVAETNLDLQALIASAEAFAGPGIIVPTRNSDLFRWCLENGLRVAQPMTLMTSGLYNEPAGAYYLPYSSKAIRVSGWRLAVKTKIPVATATSWRGGAVFCETGVKALEAADRSHRTRGVSHDRKGIY
jgi:hypothetical protein